MASSETTHTIWKRTLIILFTAVTVLSTAASCSLFGISLGGGNVLGIIKRDPEIKAEGFGFINQEKLYTGETEASGLADASGLKIAQAQGDTLYWLTQNDGFFKTTDGGRTWERKYVFGFTGTATEGRALQNEINNWIDRNNQFKSTDFAVASDNSEIFYIAGQFENVGRIYKTDTGGNNFKQVYTSVEQDGYVRFVAVDPQNNSNVYAIVGADTVIRSTNGGETWQKMFVFTNQTVVQLGFFAETSSSLYALSKRGGVSFSRDNGSSWETRELGKGESVLKEEGRDGGLFSPGTSGNTSSFREYEKLVPINNGQSWVLIADQQIWFSGSVQNVFNKILLPTEAVQYETYDITPFPGQGSRRMLVGVNDKLFETNDGGVTWSTDDKIGLDTPIGNIGQILIDRDDSEVIYLMLVGKNTTRRDGLYQSTGGGSMFR